VRFRIRTVAGSAGPARTDALGNLWTVGQNSGNAYLIESGLPTFSDVSWLSVSPTDGTVAKDGNQPLAVTVDTTGLSSGVYHAIAVIQTNDPDHANIQVPVTLVVPAYQQGINPGGGSYMDPAQVTLRRRSGILDRWFRLRWGELHAVDERRHRRNHP